MMDSRAQQPDLLQGDIRSTLVRLTVPMLFGMATLMSFSLVDTFFISFLGTVELAAVSFTFPITFLMISLAIGLSIGASAVIAKAHGSGQAGQAKSDATAALWLTSYVVLALSVLGYFCIDPLFRLLGAQDETLPFIHQYMSLWFLGSVFLVTPMVGNAVLRATGDTKTPSALMMCSGAVNAVLDPLFIFGWGPVPALGVTGAALASLISWLVGFGLVLYLLIKKRQLVRAKHPSFVEFKQSARKLLPLGLPAAGANMLTPLAMALLTALMASYGPEAVAAFGVGARIESLACLVVLALTMTLPPFISQNLGAGAYARIEAAYKISVAFVVKWQLGVYLGLVLFSWFIATAFTDDAQVAKYICYFLWVLPLGYGLQGIIVLSNSALNALHLPLAALWLSVVRLFVFYVPLAWLGGALFGVLGVFVGGVLGNLCVAFIARYWFGRSLWQLRQPTK